MTAKLATRINTLNMVNTLLLSMLFTSPGISNGYEHQQNFLRSCDVLLPQKATKDTKSFQIEEPHVAFGRVSGVVKEKFCHIEDFNPRLYIASRVRGAEVVEDNSSRRD
jgi:hypothetical protein